MKGHCVHVRLCRQCPGADVADVHVAAGHAAAPCGNGARSTSRLRTRLRCAAGAAPPSTALRVRSAAIQRRAEAGAAGACVSAAPAGVPRGRRAFKKAAQVAGKGTSLPGGAFEHIFANWVATGLNCATWHNMHHRPCQPLCTYKISGPKAQWLKRNMKGTAKPFFQPKK